MKNIENTRAKNNVLIIVVIVGIAVIIPGILLLKNFLSSAGMEDNGPDQARVENMKMVNAKIKERGTLNRLDTGLFNDSKFNALRAYEIKAFDVKSLDVGKENPFEK